MVVPNMMYNIHVSIYILLLQCIYYVRAHKCIIKCWYTYTYIRAPYIAFLLMKYRNTFCASIEYSRAWCLVFFIFLIAVILQQSLSGPCMHAQTRPHVFFFFSRINGMIRYVCFLALTSPGRTTHLSAFT